MTELLKKKFAPPILFMGKVLALFVFMFGKQLFRFILQKFDQSLLFGRRATPLTLFY
jgi:uncharacterized BrkB/YihY/UPF0761 family membrane protein